MAAVPRNLYMEWKDALGAPEFDASKLQEIHTLWQAKKQREAEWLKLWDQCSDEWKAECALIESQVRMELEPLSKLALIERLGWQEKPKDFTKEMLLHWLIQDAQRNVRGVQARTQEAWKKLHGSPTGQA